MAHGDSEQSGRVSKPGRPELSKLHTPTSLPEYVNNLEKSLRVKEEECTALQNQVDAQRDEIDDLRQRLSLPLMPSSDTALGLVVPNSEWHEGVPSNDRKVWRRQGN